MFNLKKKNLDAQCIHFIGWGIVIFVANVYYLKSVGPTKFACKRLPFEMQKVIQVLQANSFIVQFLVWS
jgi:hypothetical protein